jgi:hypothetical protein
MNIRLILILASLLWLISCNKGPEEDVYVSLDHTQWFKYEDGDTLIFKNNVSVIDTYILGGISTYWANVFGENIFDEHLLVSYNEIAQCSNCPIGGFERNPFGVVFSGSFPSSFALVRSGDATTEYKLGDTTIQNVFVVEDLLIDTTHFNVKAIYYSHIYGVIRYDMYDDRVYELQLE